jgi:predicted PurR-regulated permease PerM
MRCWQRCASRWQLPRKLREAMMKLSELSLLRVWLWGSAAIFLSALVWTFVPILIPFAVVVAALAALTYVIRLVTRRFEARRDE